MRSSSGQFKMIQSDEDEDEAQDRRQQQVGLLKMAQDRQQRQTRLAREDPGQECRLVRLCHEEASGKLGFSLRGGKFSSPITADAGVGVSPTPVCLTKFSQLCLACSETLTALRTVTEGREFSTAAPGAKLDLVVAVARETVPGRRLESRADGIRIDPLIAVGQISRHSDRSGAA